ncbi:hypothetical protein BJX65DRAFT_305672 [Aspergillus insuetus]
MSFLAVVGGAGKDFSGQILDEPNPPSPISIIPGRQEASATHSEKLDYEAGDTGDASVYAFLRKVSSHLAQVGQGLPRSLFKNHEENDRLLNSSCVGAIVLPDKETAKTYLKAYFNHGNATCRFLRRDEIFGLLDSLYADSLGLSDDHARMALIMLVCLDRIVEERALTFMEGESVAESQLTRLKGLFPPTLRVLQAQLVKCQCELVLGRFNSAWMSLGWVVRLGQMVDIQKQPAAGNLRADTYARRRLFWSMFMIDRYLAILLGRPFAIHERDISIPISADLDQNLAGQTDSYENNLLAGTAAHCWLVRIIGRAASKLYPAAQRRTTTPTEQIVCRLESELQQWLEDTPRFFHPRGSPECSEEDRFYAIPWILKRQQRTVQAAYFFANMLIYRGYLLQEFLYESPGRACAGPVSERVKKCVDNATAMLALAAQFRGDERKYNGTFWFTSHFIFCAIAILVVYLSLCDDANDKDIIERMVEDAIIFHRTLDDSANIKAQRLIDASRARAQIAQAMETSTSLLNPPLEEEPDSSAAFTPLLPSELHGPMDQSLPPQNQHHGLATNSTDQPLLLPYDFFESRECFNMIMDIGFDGTGLLEPDGSLSA